MYILVCIQHIFGDVYTMYVRIYHHHKRRSQPPPEHLVAHAIKVDKYRTKYINSDFSWPTNPLMFPNSNPNYFSLQGRKNFLIGKIWEPCDKRREGNLWQMLDFLTPFSHPHPETPGICWRTHTCAIYTWKYNCTWSINLLWCDVCQ